MPWQTSTPDPPRPTHAPNPSSHNVSPPSSSSVSVNTPILSLGVVDAIIRLVSIAFLAILAYGLLRAIVIYFRDDSTESEALYRAQECVCGFRFSRGPHQQGDHEMCSCGRSRRDGMSYDYDLPCPLCRYDGGPKAPAGDR